MTALDQLRDMPRAELGPAPVIRFGPLDHQTLSLEVASMVLTMWRDRQPAQFGAVLAEAMTGTAPARGRNRGAR